MKPDAVQVHGSGGWFAREVSSLPGPVALLHVFALGYNNNKKKKKTRIETPPSPNIPAPVWPLFGFDSRFFCSAVKSYSRRVAA